ncbi:MAG: hypothetical protein OXF02_04490 [Simkaniaceae bacterium]|nr:hypothetical protein [Simkaniaceae bacterium]
MSMSLLRVFSSSARTVTGSGVVAQQPDGTVDDPGARTARFATHVWNFLLDREIRSEVRSLLMIGSVVWFAQSRMRQNFDRVSSIIAMGLVASPALGPYVFAGCLRPLPSPIPPQHEGGRRANPITPSGVNSSERIEGDILSEEPGSPEEEQGERVNPE